MSTLIVVALCIFLIVWPCSRYAGFLVSNFRAGFLGEIRTRLGGLFVPILRGITTAVAAETIAVASYPWGWFQRDVSGPGMPVMLVHGLFHNSSGWLVMRHRLRRAGFSNVHTYQYNSFTRDFGQAVDGMERKLDQVLKAYPDEKVMLVGHSLGGLVCRKVAGNSRYNDRVAALVALGSPHKGSQLAWWGGNAMARGLIPGRDIPSAVATVPDPDCPRLAVYTLVDDFVFPLNMLLPDREGWEEKQCSPMGHVWMLYSREVAEMVIDFLRRI